MIVETQSDLKRHNIKNLELLTSLIAEMNPAVLKSTTQKNYALKKIHSILVVDYDLNLMELSKDVVSPEQMYTLLVEILGEVA